MDPVTHMMTGACLSRAGLNRKTGLATLTLTLALEAPDIDLLIDGVRRILVQHEKDVDGLPQPVIKSEK